MKLTTAAASLALTLSAVVASPGDSTLSYTAAQSTAIQTRLIPQYNAEHCGRFNLAANCSSANLVTAGCTVQTVRTIVTDSCTIFTTNIAGEALFLKEMANQALVTTFNRIISTEIGQYTTAACAQWKALSPAAQQTDCTNRGLPSTCSGPCP